MNYWKLLAKHCYTVSWLLATAMGVGVLLFATISVQQMYRQSANDPQTMMVDQAQAELLKGKSPGAVVTSNKVNIATNSSPYLMIFDKDDTLLASGAELDGTTPTIPKGVLESAKQAGGHKVTWQPREDIRQAIVLKSDNNGIVLAGRSLKATEDRIGMLMIMYLFALAGLLAGSLVLYCLNKPTRAN